MKNSVSVLRTTTALVISLSLVGTHAATAAGTGDFVLAQTANTEDQVTRQNSDAEQPATQPAVEPVVPAVEAPAVEAQTTTEAPAVEAQATTEAPAVEATTEAPATEAQATTEAPAVEATTEAPATETKATSEQPAAEAQATTTTEQPAAEATTEQPAAEAQATTEQPAAETATTEQPAAEATTEQPAAEAQATTEQPAPETQATTEQPAAEAQATTDQPATAEQTAAQEADDTAVEQVSEEQIKEVTSSGNDVVVSETTTDEELRAELDALKAQQADLETRLLEASESQEEVVTEATARAAGEEAIVRKDDDNNVWKYLGAAAAGAAVGALVPALGGRLVQNQGDRVIVEREGEFFVRSDENLLLRQPGTTVQTEEFPSGLSRTTVNREDGSKIVTIRNEGGFILRRTRILPNGDEIVLLEQTPQEVYAFNDWADQMPDINANKVQTVNYASASQEDVRVALASQPTYDVSTAFPLQAVRESVEVRGLVPAIDLPINFASGSSAIQQTEVEELTALGRMIKDIIEQNPREIFLVEGHTDAVGSNLMNLALSDRRAEAVALALTQYFDVPPENLVVQGYGERYLKEQTPGASDQNRRAAVRRITPLIDRVASR